jgi:GNAT superfamily N-acetyltransferase
VSREHPEVRLRAATEADLAAINAVIEAAIMSWDLPERVKRLSLATYQYHTHDLEHMGLMVAEVIDSGIVGIVAWETADSRDVPFGQRALLIHGLYVDPAYHHHGIGSQLLAVAEQAARDGGFDGLLIKAQADAEGFFIARGMECLPVADAARDYPYRFWKRLSG